MIVRDETFWCRVENNEIDVMGRPISDCVKADWNVQAIGNMLRRHWWEAEHDFNPLGMYGAMDMKQLLIRMSYLPPDELEFLHRKYASKPSPLAITDKELAAEYGMSRQQFIQWRTRILWKLHHYKEYPSKD